MVLCLYSEESFQYVGILNLVYWLSFRVTRFLYWRIRDQLNGKEDWYSNFQNDIQYDEFHRDSKDLLSVNFRYSDHEDTAPQFGFWNHDILKPDADYAKALLKHYKKGTDSYWDWITKGFKMH